MNLYEELGIDINATLNEIKKAFRKLSKIHHPDKGGDENKFMDITKAYEILSDINKRKMYDTDGTISDGVDNTAQMINGKLAELFDAWLLNMIKGQKIDMKKFFADNISKMIKSVNTHKDESKNSMEKLNKIKENSSCKTGNNILHNIINDKIKIMEHNIDVCEKELKIINKLESLIDDYEFKNPFEEPIDENDIFFEILKGREQSNSQRGKTRFSGPFNKDFSPFYSGA